MSRGRCPAARSTLLVDGMGHTLYVFTKDTQGKASACTGGCAKYWPPLLVPAGTTAPTTVAGVSGAFGTISRADGSTQLTYEGWPLYTFLKDTMPGQTNGQAVGGTWWDAVASAAPPSTAKATSMMSTTAPLVQAAQTAVLVDSRGHTLYMFTADTLGKASACAGGCAHAWRPLLVPKGTTAPTAVPGVSGTFGTISRADGTTQLTYEGWPLYTWFKDKKPGDMTGQAVGGTWWALVAAPPTVK
jgi:predicted lipoprotein with Yx(FWY)xxD motif